MNLLCLLNPQIFIVRRKKEKQNKAHEKNAKKNEQEKLIHF